MYILKTKGTAKIPDYIQIRDDDFILIDHFRADNSENISALATAMADKSACAKTLTDKLAKRDKFLELINKLPYGILKKIDMF